MNTISAKYMQFLSAFIAKQDVRYYLCGLLIEKAEKGAFLVAMDGHKIAVVHDEDAVVDETMLVDVPALIVTQSKKGETIRFDGETASVFGAEGDLIGSARAKKIDGNYPLWRAVIPKPCAKAFDSAVNVDYLAVAKLVPGGRYRSVVAYNHEHGRPITLRFPEAPEIIAAIMPMRSEEIPERPTWLTDKAWSPPVELPKVAKKRAPKKMAKKKAR